MVIWSWTSNVVNRDQNVPVGSTPTDTIGPRSRSRLSPRYVLVVLKWRKNRSTFKPRRVSVFSFDFVQSDSFLCQPTDEHNRETFACESDHSRLATIIMDVPVAVENLPVVWIAYKSGLEPTAPKLADRKIALYRLSQILNYKTDGSLVNFRRKSFQSTQKTTEEVDNGHSKPECRSFDVDLHCYTFISRFGSGLDCTAYGGTGAIAPEHAAAKRGHYRFFFWSEKKGGFVRTLRTPLGYVPAHIGNYKQNILAVLFCRSHCKCAQKSQFL